MGWLVAGIVTLLTFLMVRRASVAKRSPDTPTV